MGTRSATAKAQNPSQGRVGGCSPELLEQFTSSSANKLHALAAAMANKAVTPAARPDVAALPVTVAFSIPNSRGRRQPRRRRKSAHGKFDAYLGSNRTCEIGLNLATGKNYESFVYLLEELTRPTLVGQTMTSAQCADFCTLEKGAAE